MSNVRIEDAACICLLGAQENEIEPIETNITLLEVCHIIVSKQSFESNTCNFRRIELKSADLVFSCTKIVTRHVLKSECCTVFLERAVEAFDYVPKEEERRVLSQYLSGLTLTKDDSFGLRLPVNEIPEGFRFTHKRSSKRTVYAAKPGFSIILSKECSWRSVLAEESSKESVIIL